jgi:ammonia channel protein AmtB
VHVNAGVALVAAKVVGPRRFYPSGALLPHSISFTLLGAGLLWFGWFGFTRQRRDRQRHYAPRSPRPCSRRPPH